MASRVEWRSVFGPEFNPIDGITATVWKGTCLGEPVIDGGLVNAEMKALKVALRHGITDVTYENGAGVDTLYMPAFEV
jgi:hypothetical protein